MIRDVSAVVAVLCVFLLALCLVLSISTLTILHRTVEESNAALLEAHAYLRDFAESASEPPSETQQDTAVNATPSPIETGYWMREVNGRVAIYTASGELVFLTNVSPQLLPTVDRDRIQAGIYTDTWGEMQELITDFGG